MAEAKSAAATMAELINKGKATDAWAYATGPEPTEADKADANFWFMSALAARQFTLESAEEQTVIQRRFAMAKQCANYSQQMEGDFHRDAAIGFVRTGDLGQALSELEAALRLHAGDPNREAAVDMVRGRIEFADKRYADAMFFHNRADRIWSDLEADELDFDEQWVLNNRYHRLRAAVSLLPGTARIARADYRYVMRNSRDGRQRKGARFARYAGAEGVAAFDRLIARGLVR